MKKVFLLFVPLLVALVSCEDMVTNVDVPQSSEPHYVLHAYFSPEDTAVTVYVSKSMPVFGNQDTDTAWMSQVHVFVNEFELPRVSDYYVKFSAPIGDVPVTAGQTYTVSLKVNGVTECSGSCTIPANRNESLVFEGIDSVETEQFEGTTYYEYYASYSFTDFAGAENFYRIGAEVSYLDPYSGDTVVYEVYSYSEDFIRDILFDGEEYSGRLQIYMESLSSLVGLKLSLYTSDSNYFFYHRAILSQNGDDPFSEPVIIPTNVDNGLGCVAGYRKFTLVLF